MIRIGNWALLGETGKGKLHFEITAWKYEFSGSIHTTTRFDYFPYEIAEEKMENPIAEFMDELKPSCELWKVICELEKLSENADILYRPFKTLSPGERTKAMLAILFSEENDFCW